MLEAVRDFLSRLGGYLSQLGSALEDMVARLTHPWALWLLAVVPVLWVVAIFAWYRRRRDLSAGLLLGLSTGIGWLLLFVPYLLAEGLTAARLKAAAAALPATAAAALCFYLTQPRIDDCPSDTPRWLRQGCSAGLGSVLGLVPLYLL